ncbi:unnamed protein product [Moneuplotes crassus]|uniref:Uncharacterized protein n=2 Tax=Euplotes crassus TaxID=5936 RepID=A0AAD1Y597_EUPCR|nr:unnamed protein product [Moneuplotes crassus]
MLRYGLCIKLKKILSKSVEKDFIVRIRDESNKQTDKILIKPGQGDSLKRYKAASLVKTKPIKKVLNEKLSRQQSREKHTSFMHTKTAQDYSHGIRKEIEDTSDNLNVTGFNRIAKDESKDDKIDDQKTLKQKILTQIHKSRQPRVNTNQYSSDAHQSLIANKGSLISSRENFKKETKSSSFTRNNNPFSLIGSKKPMTQKENMQIKLNGRNIKLSTTLTKKSHICSRFIKRGNKPIMWCRETNDNNIKYHNKKRRTKNGTLWVRRPKTPPSYNLSNKDLPEMDRKVEIIKTKIKEESKRQIIKNTRSPKKEEEFKKALSKISKPEMKILSKNKRIDIEFSKPLSKLYISKNLKVEVSPLVCKGPNEVRSVASNKWKEKMDNFYQRVRNNYNSSNSTKCQKSRNQYKNFLTEKIKINKMDQNLAFWDFQDHFGTGRSLLDLTPSELKYYRMEYGENAVSQGYLCAKMNKRHSVKSTVDSRRLKMINTGFSKEMFTNSALSRTRINFIKNEVKTIESAHRSNTLLPISLYNSKMLEGYKLIDNEFEFKGNYYLEIDHYDSLLDLLYSVVEQLCEKKEVKGVMNNLKIFYSYNKNSFICLFGQKHNKISPCCRLPMYMTFSVVFGLRMQCVDKYCSNNPVYKSTFHEEQVAQLNTISQIFIDQENTHKEEDQEDQCISILLKDSNLPTSAFSFTRGMSQETIKSEQKDYLSQYVSKKVKGGEHKHSSLRDINYM